MAASPVSGSSFDGLQVTGEQTSTGKLKTRHQETWAGERLSTLYRRLQTSDAGLSHRHAGDRFSRFGSNELVFHHSRSAFLMLLDEFRALFPLLLMIAVGLAFVADYLSPGEGYDLIGIALPGVAVLNALVPFSQNYKVEKLMMAFLDHIPKSVNLSRESEMVSLDSKDLVPGDALLVQEIDGTDGLSK